VAGGMSHTIGVLVKGHNALSGALVKAEHSLTAFRKTAEATALSVNSKLSAPDIDTGAIDKASSRLTGMGTTAMIAGGVVAAGLGVAVHSATKFNTAMAEVSTLVDTSTTDMDALAGNVRSLSKEFGQMPVDTAKALYTTISAGFGDAQDATVMLEGAMKLARGGITDTETAIDGLTSIMNSYGMAADQVTGVSDQMFVAMKAGKTTIGELSSSMGKVTPLAASAGVGLDQLLAATSALTLGGLKTSEATTSLRGMLAAVVKPTAEASKTAKELGIDFSGAAVKSMGLANWLAHVKEKTGGSQEKMATLFGSVEALTGVLALTGNQASAFTDILGQMQTASGATEEAFRKVDATAGAAFDRAKANAAVLMDTVGNALLPVVSGLANAFAWVSDKISLLADAHPFLTKLVVVLVAVTAAVALIGGAAMIMGGKVVAAMALVNVSTGGILLAIGALVTGITLLVMYFSSGTESMIDDTTTFGRVLGGLKAAFYAVVTPIAYGVGFLVGMFEGGWEGIKRVNRELWLDLKLVAVGTWNAVQNALVAGIEAVVGFFKWAWDGICAGVSAAWAVISHIFTASWTGITMAVTAGWEAICGAFNTALAAVTGAWNAAWDAMKTSFAALWENVKGLVTGVLDWFSGIGDMFMEAGKGLIDALWEGIKAAWSGLVENVTGLMGDLRDLLPFSDAKAGPLSELTASGSALVTTFSEGLSAVADVPIKALSGLLEGVRDLLPFSDAKRGPLSELTTSGASVMPAFASGIEKTADLPARAVSAALSNVSLEAPRIPPMQMEMGGQGAAPAPASETGSSSKAGIVFERGAFQITVNGADGLDDLEGQLTEIFSRAALQLGVANG
jgi:TP901 family phage tail tape measure protein